MLLILLLVTSYSSTARFKNVAIYSASFAESSRRVRARVATVKKKEKRETGGFACGGEKLVIPDRSWSCLPCLLCPLALHL